MATISLRKGLRNIEDVQLHTAGDEKIIIAELPRPCADDLDSEHAPNIRIIGDERFDPDASWVCTEIINDHTVRLELVQSLLSAA